MLPRHSDERCRFYRLGINILTGRSSSGTNQNQDSNENKANTSSSGSSQIALPDTTKEEVTPEPENLAQDIDTEPVLTPSVSTLEKRHIFCSIFTRPYQMIFRKIFLHRTAHYLLRSFYPCVPHSLCRYRYVYRKAVRLWLYSNQHRYFSAWFLADFV